MTESCVTGANPNPGDNDAQSGGGSALDRISAMIPPPPKPKGESVKGDEEDWN